MTRSNTGLWNATYGEVGATLKALENRGVTLDDLKAIRSDSKFADQVAAAMKVQRDGNVYDVRSVNGLLSLHYTMNQIVDAGPPPDALPGFLTFFDPGWSLQMLRKFC